MHIRRTRTINDTKIQYLSVTDKIYKVTDIDFKNLVIGATKTNLSIVDVPEGEMFPLEEFGEFRIRLCNGGGSGEIVDFSDWVRVHRGA